MPRDRLSTKLCKCCLKLGKFVVVLSGIDKYL